MAKLVKLREWVENSFDSEISIRTAQNWCKQGYLPSAKKVGDRWFIDPEMESKTTGNSLVDMVLQNEPA